MRNAESMNMNTMNTTTPPPTPETDAIILPRNGFGLTQYEWREHARRLERERDEARRNAEVERLNGAAVVKLCRRLESERGEARALNSDMLKLMRRLHLAITARMSADNPTDEQRLELRLAWEEAGKFLEGSMPMAQTMNTNTEQP